MAITKVKYFFGARAFRVATAFGIQVAGAGLAVLFNIFLARSIGVDGVGLYFLAVTIIDIGATVSRLGLETAGLRFASVAYGQGDRATLAALYRRCMGLTLATGIAIAFPIWLIVAHSSLGGALAPELRAKFPVMLCAVAPLALLIVQAEFLKSINASGSGTFSYSVMPPLLLLTGGAVLWLTSEITLRAVFSLYVVAAVGALTVAAIIWNRSLPGLWRQRGTFEMRLLLQTSMPMLVITGMTLVMGWTDILALGIWSGAREVGVYGIAMRIALLTTFVLSAVNVVVAPQFATLHAAGDIAGIKRVAQRSAFWIQIVAVPMILVLVTVPDLVLQVFGPEFREGAWPLRILAFGQLVNLATGPVGTILVMTGHERIVRNSMAKSAALNLVGNLVLVPAYGAIGAAASTALALAFMNVALWVNVRNRLSFSTLDCSAWRKVVRCFDFDTVRPR